MTPVVDSGLSVLASIQDLTLDNMYSWCARSSTWDRAVAVQRDVFVDSNYDLSFVFRSTTVMTFDTAIIAAVIHL